MTARSNSITTPITNPNINSSIISSNNLSITIPDPTSSSPTNLPNHPKSAPISNQFNGFSFPMHDDFPPEHAQEEELEYNSTTDMVTPSPISSRRRKRRRSVDDYDALNLSNNNNKNNIFKRNKRHCIRTPSSIEARSFIESLASHNKANFDHDFNSPSDTTNTSITNTSNTNTITNVGSQIQPIQPSNSVISTSPHSPTNHNNNQNNTTTSSSDNTLNLTFDNTPAVQSSTTPTRRNLNSTIAQKRINENAIPENVIPPLPQLPSTINSNNNNNNSINSTTNDTINGLSQILINMQQQNNQNTQSLINSISNLNNNIQHHQQIQQPIPSGNVDDASLRELISITQRAHNQQLEINRQQHTDLMDKFEELKYPEESRRIINNNNNNNNNPIPQQQQPQQQQQQAEEE